VVAEGSAELRFPILDDFLGASFLGAVFVDVGYLSQNTNATLAKSKTALTPGFGVRYLSPVGPIRVDIGINPVLRETLPVVTEEVVGGKATLVTVGERRLFNQTSGFLSRLTLHLAIGEAF